RALCDWETERLAVVDYVAKGSNVMTEHYSAIQADVPDPSDPSTQLNTKIVRALERADGVAIAGEALTHCVPHPVPDVPHAFDDAESVSKLVLLSDASSAIPGFEPFGDAFVRDLTARGMRTATTAEFLDAR